MTDIEMLPLPEWTKRDDAGQNMVPSEIRVAMADYGHAVAEHNVKKRDAEIEALRAEVAEWKASYQQAADSSLAHAERAERLADALRDLEPFAQHHDSCGDHDAYNNSPIRTCGCGLDSLLERIAALRDHDQENSRE